MYRADLAMLPETRNKLWSRWPVAALALLALLAACAGPAQELPFETVDRASYSRTTGEYWEVDAPGLAVIIDPSEVAQLDTSISPDAESQLHELDYGTQFALAAFMGMQGCYISDFRIEQVLLREKELELYAYHTPFGQERGCSVGASSPYHIIALARAGVWEEAERFTLYINDEHRVSGSYPPVVSQATPAPTPTQKPAPAQTPRPTETPSPP